MEKIKFKKLNEIAAFIRFVALLTIYSVFVSAQETKNISKGKQVMINISILNRDRGMVKDLKKEDFHIYENNKPVEISYFSNENFPISVGFLIDVSRSMGNGADFCREEILQFIDKSNSKNEYFVAGFSKKITLVSDFTNADEIAKIISANPYFLKNPKPGETVLYDAINFGINSFSKAVNQKKVLFIFFDNSDEYSSGDYNQLLKVVKEKNITVYPIGCRPEINGFSTAGINLEKLAEISGGRYTSFEDGFVPYSYRPKVYLIEDDFKLKIQTIAEQLQNQYVLGYQPNLESKDNSWRKLDVKLQVQKALKKQIGDTFMEYRKGYYPFSEVVTDN